MVLRQNGLIESALEMDKLARELWGFDALRPEVKLLLILSRTGSLRIKEAMSLSGLSYRGFYILLKRLTEKGITSIEGDHADGRVRKIRLSSRSAEMLTRAAAREPGQRGHAVDRARVELL